MIMVGVQINFGMWIICQVVDLILIQVEILLIYVSNYWLVELNQEELVFSLLFEDWSMCLIVLFKFDGSFMMV